MNKTRFKKSEWNQDVTKALLKEMLGDFYNEFRLHDRNGWSTSDINLFLHINHWLYKEQTSKIHHFATIVSILKEMLV